MSAAQLPLFPAPEEAAERKPDLIGCGLSYMDRTCERNGVLS